MKFISCMFLLVFAGTPLVAMQKRPASAAFSSESKPKYRAGGSSEPERASEVTITLVSSEGREFKMPKDVVMQSGTLKNVLIDIGDEGSILLPFDNRTLNDLSKAFLKLYRHKKLSGKALFDAVDKDLEDVSFPLSLVKAADWLEFPRLIEYEARHLVDHALFWEKDATAILTEVISGQGLGEGLQQVIPQIARYYFLRTGKSLPKVDCESYGFSIRDYLEYRPEFVKPRFDDDPMLNLGNLQLQNLNGLSEIHTNNDKVRDIFLDHNQLKKIDPGMFRGFAHLQSISIGCNKITQIAPGAFQGLTNLQTLFIYKNKLTQIQPNTFRGLENLHILELGLNELTQIDSGAFQGLAKLKTLDLGGNKLTQIAPDTFRGLQNLETLDLRDNELTQIAPDIFQGLTKLRMLILCNNKLTQIDPNTFKGLTNLQSLGLLGNQLAPEKIKELKEALPKTNLP